MDIHDGPFIGSEALEKGLVGKYELRSRYRAVFPDVYVSSEADSTPLLRIRAAWLWSRRQGVIAGRSASAVHGAKWVADSSPVELIWPNNRSPNGIRTYDYRLHSGEFSRRGDMVVTSVERTAFDVGRSGRLNEAVARLDALGSATRFHGDAVLDLARRHRGARHLRQLEAALDLHDPGAESPRETWLRLLLIEAGFPRPRTQIPVAGVDGSAKYYLDMGWEDLHVAVEYDGDHHRLDVQTWRNDVIRSEYVRSRNWNVVRVVAGQQPASIVRRVSAARASRLR